MSMTIRKAFKFRLNPHSDQIQMMVKFAGANRFVWNKALAMNLFRLDNKQPLMWYQELAFWLVHWKRSEDFGFLATAPSQTLQQTLKNLDRAFKDTFDKNKPPKRIPRFKKKGSSSSFRYPQGYKLEQGCNRVFLPKIGWVKYRNSRQVEGDVKNVTVSRRGSHWYVSIQTEYQVAKPLHPASSIVGIDLGVTQFATLSDGRLMMPEHPEKLKQLEAMLAFWQRKLSRKVKFSANWRKVKDKIARIHERIANSRNDFLHKTSTALSKNHAMMVVEDLKIRNMSASAKGDVTHPGRNVKAKSGLNKSILSQGWGLFVQMLEYKQVWLGGDVLRVDPKYTSQTCPCCGHVSKDNRLKQAQFRCVSCYYSNHADIVGAINILARGHRVLACGVDALATSLKQEPAGRCEAYPLLSA